MIAMPGFDLRGEDFQSFSPISIPVKIVNNIVMQPIDCLKGQPAQR